MAYRLGAYRLIATLPNNNITRGDESIRKYRRLSLLYPHTSFHS